MLIRHPTIHFFTCGAAEGTSRANALDGARLAAGIGDLGLVSTQAVIPPACRLVEPLLLAPGTLVPAACATITSDVPGEVISAGIAAAYPADENRPGLVMQYAARGHKEDIEAIVRRMAEEGIRMRGIALGDMRSIAVQHRVAAIGSAIAALVLWDED